jgi:hypothetical protein
MAKAGSIVGGKSYHLSVPYLRSRAAGGAGRFRRPSAKELRAGQALGHPRPGGRPDEPAVVGPAQPGTQTDSDKE